MNILAQNRRVSTHNEQEKAYFDAELVKRISKKALKIALTLPYFHRISSMLLAEEQGDNLSKIFYGIARAHNAFHVEVFRAMLETKRRLVVAVCVLLAIARHISPRRRIFRPHMARADSDGGDPDDLPSFDLQFFGETETNTPPPSAASQRQIIPNSRIITYHKSKQQ